MAKKPKPLLLKPSLAKRFNLKTIAAWLGLFIALGGAVTVWDQFGWWHPASIQYVNGKVDPGIRTLKDVQVELAEGKRDQTQENLFKWQDRLEEEKDATRRAIYRERVRDLELTLSKQNSQIRTLTRDRGR